AEDGIRDLIVTGVQTCALPILRAGARGPAHALPRNRPRAPALLRRRRPVAPPSSASRNRCPAPERAHSTPRPARAAYHLRSRSRSEERRVGKECRGGVEAVRWE